MGVGEDEQLLIDLCGNNITYIPWDCLNNLSTADVAYWDYEEPRFVRVENLVAVSLFSLALLIGVPGNGLVVFVVLRSGALKTTTNLYLMNLALSDLLFLVFCVPITMMEYLVPYWPLGEGACKAANYLRVVTMAASVMTLTSMGIERYNAVARPVQSRLHRNVRQTLKRLGCVWGAVLVVASPILYTARLVLLFDRDQPRDFCIEWFPTVELGQAYTLTFFILLYTGPLLIIGICYFLMAKHLWTSVRPGVITTNTIKSSKSRRKVARLVLVVVIVFAFCWLPISVVNLRNAFGPPYLTRWFYVVKIVAHGLSYANSAINPVIYSFLNEAFRQAFKTTLCCKRQTANAVFIVVRPKKGSGPPSPRQRPASLTVDPALPGPSGLCAMTPRIRRVKPPSRPQVIEEVSMVALNVSRVTKPPSGPAGKTDPEVKTTPEVAPVTLPGTAV